MAKFLCTERCFDSQKCRSYYEEEVYDLSDSEIEHLIEIGQAKRFSPLEPRIVSKPEKNTGSEEGSKPNGQSAGPTASEPKKPAAAPKGSTKKPSKKGSQ